MHPFLEVGKLYAPYFIFVRCAGIYSDADLLRTFGLGHYEQRAQAPPGGPYVLIANDGTWTLVADDWLYTLWHMPSTRAIIGELAERHDLYACSVGDCDCSFSFVFYSEGRLVRNYVVESPHFTDAVVVDDFGIRLPGETEAFEHPNELDRVLSIAGSLGVRMPYKEGEVRVFAPRSASHPSRSLLHRLLGWLIGPSPDPSGTR